MKIALKYSILKTPVPKTMDWFCLASSLPLFEDEIRWKSVTDIESEYVLIARNTGTGFEIKKSDKFRDFVNNLWEKCLLENKGMDFEYALNIEIFKNDT